MQWSRKRSRLGGSTNTGCGWDELLFQPGNDYRAAWTRELVPLLEDEPFRVVDQLGLTESTDYDAACMQPS